MADISKCPGVGCPYKARCYRYLAKPNEHRQSWIPTRYSEEHGNCESYWEVDEVEVDVSDNACEYCGSTHDVRYTADPYNSELNDDDSKHYLCNYCIEESAWEI